MLAAQWVDTLLGVDVQPKCRCGARACATWAMPKSSWASVAMHGPRRIRQPRRSETFRGSRVGVVQVDPVGQTFIARQVEPDVAPAWPQAAAFLCPGTILRASCGVHAGNSDQAGLSRTAAERQHRGQARFGRCTTCVRPQARPSLQPPQACLVPYLPPASEMTCFMCHNAQLPQQAWQRCSRLCQTQKLCCECMGQMCRPS